jgi:CBS domain-containing protein
MSDTIAELRRQREEAQTRLAARFGADSPEEVSQALNALHDRLIRRVLELAEQEMMRTGRGKPPVPYAYMLFGSGGRAEQTFASDQDSGLIYADAADVARSERNRSTMPGNASSGCTFRDDFVARSERNRSAMPGIASSGCTFRDDFVARYIRAYFLALAETAVGYLKQLGYPPCEGNVMADQPAWCMPASEWAAKVDGWFEEPSWENVRHLLIVADGRCLAGDRTLADGLKDRYIRHVAVRPAVASRMAENTLRHKVLVGVFGQLLAERYGASAGTLDIKYGGYIPMVNAVRLLAVRSGIRATGTLDRIAALAQAGVWSAAEAAEAREAFAEFLRLRLLASAPREDGSLPSGGQLPVRLLAREDVDRLKKALRTGKKLQRRIERETRAGFGGR